MSHLVISMSQWFILKQRIKLEKPAAGKKILIGKIPSLLILFFLWETISWVKLGEGGRGSVVWEFSGKKRRSFSPPIREKTETVKRTI